MMIALLAALLAPPACAGVPAAPVISTAAALAAAMPATSTMTVSSLYTGDRVRDPFLPSSMGGGGRRSDEADAGGPKPVDIHALGLRGIMKDALADYALFSAEDGRSFLLKDGRVHDERGKLVPGITGRIRLKQKTVELITPDKDVQVFRLGEDEKDKDKAGEQ